MEEHRPRMEQNNQNNQSRLVVYTSTGIENRRKKPNHNKIPLVIDKKERKREGRVNLSIPTPWKTGRDPRKDKYAPTRDMTVKPPYCRILETFKYQFRYKKIITIKFHKVLVILTSKMPG